MMADQPADRFRTAATLPVQGLGDLSRARQVLAETAAAAGLDAKRIQRFQVALSEVATNALTHGNGTAAVVVRGDGTAVTAEVRDRGPGTDTSVATVLPPPTQPHGRGLWLARQLCDQVEIASSTAGTTVLLVMLLPAAQVRT